MLGQFSSFFSHLGISDLYGVSILFSLVIFFSAFLLALCLLFLVRALAPVLGLVDKPSERKMHKKIIPSGGGIAIFLGVLFAYFIGWGLIQYSAREIPGWLKFAHISTGLWRDVALILGGGAVIFVVGLVDDLVDLRPVVKLVIESLVALFLVRYDIRITLFIDSYWFSLFATWIWIILITNAFNLLDNMDGLSAGVAFIAGSIFLIVAVQTGQWSVVFMLIALLGALLGFLCYNFPPASIFMGDSGSLFIGYMMAVLTIHVTFYQKASFFPVALPILVLAIPLFDTSTVVMLRLRQGISIFKADKRHFSHRLVNLGLTPPQAVLVIYLVTFAIGLGALLLYQIDLFGMLVILLQITVILLIIHILEQVANK